MKTGNSTTDEPTQKVKNKAICCEPAFSRELLRTIPRANVAWTAQTEAEVQLGCATKTTKGLMDYIEKLFSI